MPAKTLICPNSPCKALLARLPSVWPGPQATGAFTKDFETPFPVEAHFSVRPDLAKLGDAPLLVQDSDWPQWAAAKREAVFAGEVPLMDAHLDGARWLGLVRDVTATLYRLMPAGPMDADGSFPWLGGLRTENPNEFFAALTISMQEDFALMVPDARGQLVARVLSVTFPSGWDPKKKLGMPLLGIHAPVADNQMLQRATPSIEQAILSKGPFVRYVWTLAGSGALKRAAGEDTLAHARTINDLWFRCERQVTVPIAGIACLFLIRVFVAPLTQMLSVSGRLPVLKAALLSMSPEMLDYKGIRRAAEIVLESPDA